MKVRVDDIYNDNLTLFAGNTLLLNDERLSDIMTHKNDLDLIASEHFGARELLRRNIKENNTDIYKYDMSKINRSIYACMVENLTKFSVLLDSEEFASDSPATEYGETYTHGENVKTFDYDSRVDTTTHGAQSETITHGNVNKTNTYGAQSETMTHGNIATSETIGAQTDTTTNGQRTSTNSVTSFSSSTFNDTDKNINASVIDSVAHGQQSNSGSVTQGNDIRTAQTYTDSEGVTHGDDSKTKATYQDSMSHGGHTDTVTDDETTDTKTGYRDKWANIDKKRKLFSTSALKIIVTECINAITYSMYL